MTTFRRFEISRNSSAGRRLARAQVADADDAAGVVEPLVDGSILGLHIRKTNSSAAAAANPKHDDVIPGRGAWSTIWFLVAGLSAVCVTAWLTFARGLPLAVVRHTAAVHNNSIEKDTTVDVDVDGT